MRRLAILPLLTVFSTLAVAAQPVRLYTRPELPRPQTLQRLGLKEHWHRYLPMEGRRDGIGFAQVLDHQLAVQTMSGGVIALDLETGVTQWRVRLGEPYRNDRQPATANSRQLFVTASARLHGIDRLSGITDWGYDLPGGLATAAAADDQHLFLSTVSNRLYAYLLPGFLRPGASKPANAAGYGTTGSGVAADATPRNQPAVLWGFQADAPLAQPPLVLANFVALADSRGNLLVFRKDERFQTDTFQSPGPITAPLNQSGDTIYVASQDHNIYAFDVSPGGRLGLRWRHTAGSLVLEKPMVIGPDLFVVGQDRGLLCLDRDTGVLRWQYRKADHFLAASKRLVMVGDRQGQTHVIDRQRGQPLGVLNTRDFALRLPNESSDRLVLVNHDGLVVCLRDMAKEYDQPLYHNAAPPQPAEKVPEPPPPQEEKPKEPGNGRARMP
jgi:outer membrane protein assembly factor BamB